MRCIIHRELLSVSTNLHTAVLWLMLHFISSWRMCWMIVEWNFLNMTIWLLMVISPQDLSNDICTTFKKEYQMILPELKTTKWQSHSQTFDCLSDSQNSKTWDVLSRVFRNAPQPTFQVEMPELSVLEQKLVQPVKEEVDQLQGELGSWNKTTAFRTYSCYIGIGFRAGHLGFFNSFLPTGQFFKLIILNKCLLDILFFKVLF